MAVNGKTTRRGTFWIDDFCNHTSGIQSPLLFRKWAAICTIAGALERKVWVKAFSRILYPNMYCILVGGPGIGKTESIREVRHLWTSLKDLKVAPSSVSRASLVDSLWKAKRNILRPADIPPFTEFNSLQIAATEFGAFLTAYDGEFISVMNDLYDCVAFHEEKRSLKEPRDIPNPQLTMVAGTTPDWLGTALPETAWAGGFTSRIIMIYSGEKVKVEPWTMLERDLLLENKLLADLTEIHNLYGRILWEPAVLDAFRSWYMADCPPVPEHPKLAHYIPRRHVHLLKLCQVMSVARGNDMVITLLDYQRALDFLIEAETYMPDTFRAMRYNSDSNVIDETFAFVWTLYAKRENPVYEHQILHFLSQRMPSHSVPSVLKLMVDSGVLQIASMDDRGRATYRPAPKAIH